MVIESQSLYDYLGKPAGPELGQKVHAAAISKGVFIGKKSIEKHIVPEGHVCTYQVSFLNEYFGRKSTIQLNLEDRIEALEKRVSFLEEKYLKNEKIEDDLPF